MLNVLTNLTIDNHKQIKNINMQEASKYKNKQPCSDQLISSDFNNFGNN